MKNKGNKIIASSFETIGKIKKIDLSKLTDNELLQSSRQLKTVTAAAEATDKEVSVSTCAFIFDTTETPSHSQDDLIIKAFAYVKEAVFRVLGLVTYDEQLLAAIAMYNGKLVEMQTGEGKTLAAVFPAYLNAINGSSVEIFTFNDYLARRDANLMGPVYRFLGLTVGYVQEGMNKQARQKAYACDITYVTAKEAGFDYLRNMLCYEKNNIIQRSYNVVIVDEADSILIDEARIPLVIATSSNELDKSLEIIRGIICKLTAGIDFEIDKAKNTVCFTDAGIVFIETQLKCGNLYDEKNFTTLSELMYALQGEVLYEKDIDYIIKDGNVELVDEFTGRTAENRHLPDGLQAAIEMKEGLNRQSNGQIMNQINMQGFLSLYKKVSGMTGTAVDSIEEFQKFYNLDIEVIPPHRPCLRKDNPDLIFTNGTSKNNAIVKEILRVHKTGQPILIGTNSVKESASLAIELKRLDIKCQVLNAKNDKLEAQIIEQAASLNAVTVSTNMAGRGTDIKLGGVGELNCDKVIELGGLYILGTSIYENRRIDKQLRGRAGRQGDPGVSQFFISLEDSMIKKHGIENVVPRSFNIPVQNTPIVSSKIEQGIEHFRKVVQGKNLDMRGWLWKYSFIIDKQKMVVQNRRMDILMDLAPANIIARLEPEVYFKLSLVIDKASLSKLEKQVTLYYIDKCWSEYLAYILDYRDMSYMAVLSGKNPIVEFESHAVQAFMDFNKRVENNIVSEFKNVDPAIDNIETLMTRVKFPASTWTYLLKDNSLEENIGLNLFSKSSSGFAAFAMVLFWPVIFLTFLLEHLKKKKRC